MILSTNAVINIGINNEDDLHDHLEDNILNDIDVDDPIVAGVVNDDQNNVVGGKHVLDHFVNVGVDPVIRLNLTGMSFFFFFFDIMSLHNIIKLFVCSFFLLYTMILHERSLGMCCRSW